MKWLKKGYIGLVLLFLYLPILLLVFFSFNKNGIGTWTGFTLEWYGYLFSNDEILSALWVTVSMAVLATIFSTLLGTFATLGIEAFPRRTQNVLLNINYLPVLNPDIVTAVGLFLVMVYAQLSLGYVTMLLAHIAFCTPYVVLSLLPRARALDKSMYEAALDLGATPRYALFKIILPQLRTGIITGALLAFTLSMDDFVISWFTGEGSNNLSMYIYSMARKGIHPSLNALSTLIFISVLGLLYFINRRADITEIY